MAGSVLQTKLNLSRPRRAALPRPRLLDLLDQSASATLTLVRAPAGFGKTTLLARWLECQHQRGGSGSSVAWVSLDARDNEPGTFWTCLVTALRTVAPDVGAQELAVLQDTGPLDVHQLLTTLLNDLAAASTSVGLVLDDDHVIESQTCTTRWRS